MNERTEWTAIIAEDDALIADDLKHELERNGVRVLARARSADEAVEAVRTYRPGIVILDIDLAGGSSGLMAAEAIRQQFDQGCIFLSGRLDAVTRQQVNGLEPLAVLSKPLLTSQLLDVITNHRMRFEPSVTARGDDGA